MSPVGTTEGSMPFAVSRLGQPPFFAQQKNYETDNGHDSEGDHDGDSGPSCLLFNTMLSRIRRPPHD